MPVAEPDMRVLTFRPHQAHASERRFHRQRAHHKSRAGCLACKAGRVKCDERKPRCGRCTRRVTTCVYASDPKAASPVAKLSAWQSMPALSLLSQRKIPANEKAVGISNAALISHLVDILPDMMPANADVSSILSLGVDYQFLLHAALALSASHLHCHIAHREESRVATLYQQSLAIPSFNKAMQQALDQQLADALVLTRVLLNVLSFAAVEGNEPAHSWLFFDHPQRLSWFSVSLGLKALIQRTASFQTGSALQWLYAAVDDKKDVFYGEEKPPDRIPEHWKEFLELESDADAVLFEPARFLAEVKDLEPTRRSFFLYQNFMGAIDDDSRVRDLLLRGDARVIWLLGYWMGLLCRFDHWWVRSRARLEWEATCTWMRQASNLDRIVVLKRMIEDLELANVWDAAAAE